ncbi:MAG: hypothetical protein ACP6IU_06890 [Candidatus Asgardarchaeia archaeon]
MLAISAIPSSSAFLNDEKVLPESSISHKIYVVSFSKTLDVNLINSLENFGFTIVSRSVLNLRDIENCDAILISNDWLAENLRNRSVAELLFTSTPIIFYGEYLNRTIRAYFTNYELIKWMGVVPRVLVSNESDVFSSVQVYGFSFLVEVNTSAFNDTRYPCAHIFSFATDIISITIDIINIITDINSLKDVSVNLMSEKADFNKYHKEEITASGWSLAGYVGWLSYYAYVWGTQVGKMNLKVEYYYKQSDSHPETWHWFLVHFIHESVPLNRLTAVAEAITQTDCDMDNKEGQILWSHGPTNGGGPTKTISFSPSIGESSVAAEVSYTEPTSGMYWSDQSDSGIGLHKVKHWFTVTYGQTWTVEPSGTYLKDGTKDYGSLPLTLTHYAKSTFVAYHGFYYATCEHMFGVLVYDTSISSS